MSKPTRVGIYCRVSTLGRGQSPALQAEELRAVAAQRGWDIVGEWVDEGVSGAKSSRPALDELMAAAQGGRFDVIAVWKLDRLARSVAHLVDIAANLQSWGVGLVSLRDAHIDTTTPSGRFALHILAAVAELEREMIVTRVVAGVRRAQAAGKHCGRPRVELDVRPAVAMLDLGHGIKATASSLGVSTSTLRRRLIEVGEWPRPPQQGVQNPPAGAGS